MKKERFRIIPAVYLVLARGNQVLLSRRLNTGYHDGDYSLPSGHLNGNETLAQAAVREAKEEVGIDVNQEDLRLIHVVSRKADDGERVSFFFAAGKWKGEPKIMEHHKCDDLIWAERGRLPENMIPYVKLVLEKTKNNMTYSEDGWK